MISKNYYLKAEGGKYILNGMNIQFVLKEIREYTKCSNKWIACLLIIIILQFLLILLSEPDCIYMIINAVLIFISIYIGYRAIKGVIEIKKTIK